MQAIIIATSKCLLSVTRSMIKHPCHETTNRHLFRLLPQYLLCMALWFWMIPISVCGEKIVVDDADLSMFNSIHIILTARAQELRIGASYNDYYNSDEIRELSKLVDDEFIPFLIRELIQFENAHASAYAIYGKRHYLPPPQYVQEWLARASAESEKLRLGTIPRYICLTTLAKTNLGLAAHIPDSDGVERILQWSNWWKENKDKFELKFKDAEKFDIGKLNYKDFQPTIRKLPNGLLDVQPGGNPTYREVIEKTAAAAEVKAVLCLSENNIWEQRVLRVIDFREITFSEFAVLISYRRERLPIPVRKQKGEETYYFGSCDLAPGNK